MWARLIFTGFLSLYLALSFGQKPVSQQDKSAHLKMLQNGVLLIRLSDQESKIKALQERGQMKDADALKEKTTALNDLIVQTFKEHYTFSKFHFISPEDTKQIIKDKSKPLIDVINGESIDLSNQDIYFTSYGIGNPADSFERYNRKGFQIRVLENNKVIHLDGDLFYAGVKQGFFVGPFEKNMVKTIVKLNRRLSSGSRYF